VLLAEPEVVAHLRSEEIDQLLDPVNYTGSAGAIVDRVLAARSYR
jgi:3-carboxy-cis,cis-muconate cycloisomerase